MPKVVEADRGSPACFRSGLKWRLTKFWASSGVPLAVAKTSSESSQDAARSFAAGRGLEAVVTGDKAYSLAAELPRVSRASDGGFPQART